MRTCQSKRDQLIPETHLQFGLRGIIFLLSILYHPRLRASRMSVWNHFQTPNEHCLGVQYMIRVYLKGADERGLMRASVKSFEDLLCGS